MFFLAILGIVTLVLRFIPHIPNFSPIIALAVLSGVITKGKNGFLIPLLIVIISDLILGITDVSFFIWGTILLISLFSRLLKRNIVYVCGYSLLASFFYFVVTNFGVWLMGWYSYSLWGLYNCYVRAIPFFRMQLFSTVIFSFIFYVAVEIVSVKGKKFDISRVLYKK